MRISQRVERSRYSGAGLVPDNGHQHLDTQSADHATGQSRADPHAAPTPSSRGGGSVGPTEDVVHVPPRTADSSLRIATVAEGFEEVQQLRHLEDEGCPQGQGYFFSLPLDREELPLFLAGDRESAGTRPNWRTPT